MPERRCCRGSVRQDGTRIRGIRRKRSPTVDEALKILHIIRQSPTNWWNTIDEHMVENGFKCLKESGSIFILTLYIDDVPLLGKELLVLRRIKQKLMVVSR